MGAWPSIFFAFGFFMEVIAPWIDRGLLVLVARAAHFCFSGSATCLSVGLGWQSA
jgi:hypothetical protein